MLPLPDVERIACHANASTFTMGVALSSCSLPQTRRPSFSLPAGQNEIGMGIHGAPGLRRGPLRPGGCGDGREHGCAAGAGRRLLHLA